MVPRELPARLDRAQGVFLSVHYANPMRLLFQLAEQKRIQRRTLADGVVVAMPGGVVRVAHEVPNE